MRNNAGLTIAAMLTASVLPASWVMAQTMPVLTTLHGFNVQSADSANPESALALTGGVFYAVTSTADAISSMVPIIVVPARDVHTNKERVLRTWARS